MDCYLTLTERKNKLCNNFFGMMAGKWTTDKARVIRLL